MNFEARLKKLENKIDVDQGLNYFAMRGDDGKYNVEGGVQGLTEAELDKWMQGKSENDRFFIINRHVERTV